MCAELDGLVEFGGVEGGLKGLLFAGEGSREAELLDRTEFTQVALFAFEVALLGLVESWGVRPDFVGGHSVGEFVAGYAAGVFSLGDACRLVAARGRLMGALPEGGGMFAVEASEREVRESLAGLEGELSVAAVNGPRSVVVSGGLRAALEWVGVWEERGRRTRRLRVSHAFHSVLMDPMLEEFREVAEGVVYSTPRVGVVSNVTGGIVSEELCVPEYWVRHAREAVRFADGVAALEGAGVRRFLELGPDGVLCGMVDGCLSEGRSRATRASGESPRSGQPEDVLLASAVRAGWEEVRGVLEFLARVDCDGVSVDWPALFAGSGVRRVGLPTYAFQRERYWLSSPVGVGDASGVGMGVSDHPLLGAAVQVAGGEGWLFTGRLGLDSHGWVGDHGVLETVLLPGTGFLELVLSAGRAVGCEDVQELVLEAPLVLAEGVVVQLQVVVGEPDGDGCCGVGVYSRVADARGVGGGWTRHASGTLRPGASVVVEGEGAPGVPGLGSLWPPAGAEELDVEFLYDRLAEAGFGYGPVFQGVRAAWRMDGEIYAEVALAQDAAVEAPRFGIHPALLDAALHAGWLEWGESSGGLQLPFSLGEVSLWSEGASSLRVRLSRVEGGAWRLAAFDEGGGLVLSLGALVLRPVEAGGFSRARVGNGYESMHRVEWVEPVAPPAVQERLGSLALFGGLELAGVEGERYEDLAVLAEALEGGVLAPDVVFVAVGAAGGPVGVGEGERVRGEGGSGVAGEGGLGVAGEGGLEGVAGSALAETGRVLELLQGWLARSELVGSRLVLLTCGGVAVGGGEVPDLVGGSVWGLLRSAQAEHPGRFVVVDLDPAGSGSGSRGEVDRDRGVGRIDWGGLLAMGEPQVAFRGGEPRVPRLVGVEGSGLLMVPAGESGWHLGGGRGGTLEDLELVGSPGVWEPLGVGQVRVGVRAGGLNFRDVLIALGMYPGEAVVGSEGAGVVLEVGEGVVDLVPGDRVMGLMGDAFGPVAVTERELLVGVPEGWSFVQAAGVPIVFLTAYYALVDLAGLEGGESLLVHAGAGGVGMAALQLARYLGAEVFATASPAKWGVLAGMGLDEEHVASSRDLVFAEKFLGVSGRRGVDVVLNSLAGEFVDASLGLLPRGGRFIEMGKTDVRDAGRVAEECPGVRYRAFDLVEAAGAARIQEMLVELVGLFERGVLEHLPVRAWDVRRAAEAFRFVREARHVGKVVLTVPQPVDREGTVLVTGGTGGSWGVGGASFGSGWRSAFAVGESWWSWGGGCEWAGG